VASQDRYERLVATVYLGGDSLNEWLVKQGHAWACRQYARDRNYCVWEGAARTDHKGQWNLPTTQREARCEYRSAKRGSARVTDYSHETVDNCIAAIGRSASASRSATTTPARPAVPSLSGDCRIKGNINNKNDKVYHVPGSRSYEDTRIDESKGERWFCTEEEARAAGWRAEGLTPRRHGWSEHGTRMGQ